MGRPMASRLVRAGYEVFVHNRSREVVINVIEDLSAVLVEANESAETDTAMQTSTVEPAVMQGSPPQ
jgi:3-hydroxyisobutyrate dehydrogenase-like beta-hydroxyacid dehydrogenase